MIRNPSPLNLTLLNEFLLFLVVVVLFQVIWELYEEAILLFWPLTIASNFIGEVLLSLTPELLNPLLRIDIMRDGTSLVLPDGFLINYQFTFSGIKQILLSVTLFLIIPGPWLRKTWFIPLNIAIILVMVILRFMVLAVHSTIYPEHYHLLQDLLFGPLFYTEILAMWMVWIVYVAKKTNLHFRMTEKEKQK
jgi:exosortase/archaeosortase family protein